MSTSPLDGFLSQAKHMCVEMGSAAAAIVVPFRWFVAKSALQQGLEPQKLGLVEGLIKGAKAAPTIGATIGTQLVAQEKIEKALANRVSPEAKGDSSFLRKVVSCMLVGAISAPLLAIFNGQTLGWGPKKSLQELLRSPKQGGCIVGRETSFVFSQSIVDPLKAKTKDVLGDKPGVQSATEFVSGGIGSLIGHPLDTALTRLQKGLPPVKGLQRMAGGGTKAVAVGFFTWGYNRFKELFHS